CARVGPTIVTTPFAYW
nr:immunoglobulin heavy chain junction region [Mus musculus]NSM04167.1 immunoglobulin heavy chain junction region [Mus musculus]NSM09477.1 immunoglobulin heavy chain junction region [Mus musculus]